MRRVTRVEVMARLPDYGRRFRDITRRPAHEFELRTHQRISSDGR